MLIELNSITVRINERGRQLYSLRPAMTRQRMAAVPSPPAVRTKDKLAILSSPASSLMLLLLRVLVSAPARMLPPLFIRIVRRPVTLSPPAVAVECVETVPWALRPGLARSAVRPMRSAHRTLRRPRSDRCAESV